MRRVEHTAFRGWSKKQGEFRNSVQRWSEDRQAFEEKRNENRQDSGKVLRCAENKERQGLYVRIELAGESQCVGGPSIFGGVAL